MAWSLCFPSLPKLPGGQSAGGTGNTPVGLGGTRAWPWAQAVGTSPLSPATTAATGPVGQDWEHGLPVALAVLLLLCDPEKDHND